MNPMKSRLKTLFGRLILNSRYPGADRTLLFCIWLPVSCIYLQKAEASADSLAQFLPFSGPALYSDLAYRQSVTRDFEQDRLVARTMELALGLSSEINSTNFYLDYMFKFPVANAGTRDTGVKNAIKYDHLAGIRYQPKSLFYDLFLVNASLDYIFYGLTKVTSNSVLGGFTAQGIFIRTPKSQVKVRLRSTGYLAQLKLIFPVSGSLFWTFGTYRSIETVKLKSLTINGEDQKYLGERTIDGRVENSNALSIGFSYKLGAHAQNHAHLPVKTMPPSPTSEESESP